MKDNDRFLYYLFYFRNDVSVMYVFFSFQNLYWIYNKQTWLHFKILGVTFFEMS